MTHLEKGFVSTCFADRATEAPRAKVTARGHTAEAALEPGTVPCQSLLVQIFAGFLFLHLQPLNEAVVIFRAWVGRARKWIL